MSTLLQREFCNKCKRLIVDNKIFSDEDVFSQLSEMMDKAKYLHPQFLYLAIAYRNMEIFTLILDNIPQKKVKFDDIIESFYESICNSLTETKYIKALLERDWIKNILNTDKEKYSRIIKDMLFDHIREIFF